MSTDFRNCIDDEFPDLFTKDLQLRYSQPPNIGGRIDLHQIFICRLGHAYSSSFSCSSSSVNSIFPSASFINTLSRNSAFWRRSRQSLDIPTPSSYISRARSRGIPPSSSSPTISSRRLSDRSILTPFDFSVDFASDFSGCFFGGIVIPSPSRRVPHRGSVYSHYLPRGERQH